MYGSGALVEGVHVEHRLVEFDGLLRVAAAIGDVVDFFDAHLRPPCAHVQRQAVQ